MGAVLDLHVARVPLLVLAVVAALPSCTYALNVLVAGGSGRVGGSTLRWLQKYSSRDPTLDLAVSVGCRTKESFDAAIRNGVVPSSGVDFVPMDLDGGDDEQLMNAIDGCGLVVNTAGPFQGRRDPALLRCCIAKRIPYVDVCDEYELAVESKKLVDKAKAAGVAAVISCGIWPGVSALMAAEAKAKLEAKCGEGACDTLDFSFFTAGTGNAGPTIVSATFLLLATPALTYSGGQPTEKEPWTERRDVDFGTGGVGVKPCWLLDNPDVPTTANALGVPNVSSRFGTDPLPWNYLFGAMKAIPKSLLYNKDAMQNFALFSEPIIRFVDKLVGATNAMRVDAKTADGKQTVTTRIVHPDLEDCVGLATAAFAIEVLKGETVESGIWYPSEMSQEARTNILEAARENTINYLV